jgi:hypothetical protein
MLISVFRKNLDQRMSLDEAIREYKLIHYREHRKILRKMRVVGKIEKANQ